MLSVTVKEELDAVVGEEEESCLLVSPPIEEYGRRVDVDDVKDESDEDDELYRTGDEGRLRQERQVSSEYLGVVEAEDNEVAEVSELTVELRAKRRGIREVKRVDEGDDDDDEV